MDDDLLVFAEEAPDPVNASVLKPWSILVRMFPITISSLRSRQLLRVAARWRRGLKRILESDVLAAVRAAKTANARLDMARAQEILLDQISFKST